MTFDLNYMDKVKAEKNQETARACGQSELAGSATGEEIVNSGCSWLNDNKNRGVPYSMTVGYWNSLISMLGIWGFKIVRK